MTERTATRALAAITASFDVADDEAGFLMEELLQQRLDTPLGQPCDD